jgi:hypothetical protein
MIVDYVCLKYDESVILGSRSGEAFDLPSGRQGDDYIVRLNAREFEIDRMHASRMFEDVFLVGSE